MPTWQRDQVQIMAQVAGSVTKVWADNTDYVQKGDPLVSRSDRCPTGVEKAGPTGRQRPSDPPADDQQQAAAGKYRRQKTALARAQADLNRRIPLGSRTSLAAKSCSARDTVASTGRTRRGNPAVQRQPGDRAGHRRNSSGGAQRPLKCVTHGWPAAYADRRPISGYVSRRSVQLARRSAPPRR